MAAFTIYVISGRELFIKRKQLRAFNQKRTVDSFKTTDVQITSELASLGLPLGRIEDPYMPESGRHSSRSITSGNIYEQYTVNIASAPTKFRQSMGSMQHKKSKAALEANSATWGYTKVALLFFVSLLVTWVSNISIPSFSDLR